MYDYSNVIVWMEAQNTDTMESLVPGALNMHKAFGRCRLAVTTELHKTNEVYGSEACQKLSAAGVEIIPVFEFPRDEPVDSSLMWAAIAECVHKWVTQLSPPAWGFDIEKFRDKQIDTHTLESLRAFEGRLLQFARQLSNIMLPVMIYPGAWGYGNPVRDAKMRWLTLALHTAWDNTPMYSTVSWWSDQSHLLQNYDADFAWFANHGIDVLVMIMLLAAYPGQNPLSPPGYWAHRDVPALVRRLSADGYTEIGLYPWNKLFKHLPADLVRFDEALFKGA